MTEGTVSQLCSARLRWIATLVLLLPLAVFAEENCKTGVVFGFFNGVQTTEQQAKLASHHHLPKLYGPTTPAGEPITYELFYNDTEGFADFVETFDQRLQEQNGLLAGRFELFFSATQGEGGWWNALTSVIPSLTALLGSFFDAYTTATIKLLISGVGDPNMAEVSSRHKQQIDHWASLNQKTLFLAHSQGNLFVNQAYAHAVSKSGNEYVRVVHVAPASPGLSGRHTLADKDAVINALRLTGTVVANTDVIPGYVHRPAGLNGSRDLIGHGLLEIYLNPALSTAGRIRTDVMTALRELDAAPRRPMPPYPDFVFRDWQGGGAPAPVYAPYEASHKLEKVVQRDTNAVAWMFKAGYGWWNARAHLGVTPHEGVSKESMHYVGTGMDGYWECAYGVPLEGFVDLGPTKECTYERVPVREYEIFRTSGAPDELLAMGNVPDGTIVYLNEMTFSRVSLFYGAVRQANTPEAFIEFYSGFLSRWDNQMGDKRSWTEPFWSNSGFILNHEALLAHSDAIRRHEKAEYERAQQHALLRWEYEQRRMVCGFPEEK